MRLHQHQSSYSRNSAGTAVLTKGLHYLISVDLRFMGLQLRWQIALSSAGVVAKANSFLASWAHGL